MSSTDQDPELRLAAALLIVAVLLAIGLVLGVGVHRSFALPSAPAAPRPVAAVPEAPATVAGDASVVVDEGVVKFYFASGQADLAPGALAALGGAIAAAQAGQQLVILGYHDATGHAPMNAELARRRALAVRDALLSAGVNASQVELRKPEVALGSGNDAEARRVEVVVGG